MKNYIKYIKILLPISLLLFFIGCFDVSVVEGGQGSPVFASGPEYGTYYSFARGLVDATGETFGVFLDNKETAGTLENAERIVAGKAYMGLVQEDVFRFARDKFRTQYAANSNTAEKKYLKIASQLKIIMAAYKEDVFLLVKDSINSISDLAGKNVNIGAEGSGSYITATRVLDAHGISCTRTTEDTLDAVNNLANGTGGDAVFWVCASPNTVLQNIVSTAAVKLIQVQMPANQKEYDETGVISAADYSFQDSTISQNLTVRSLVAVGPTFNNRVIDIFLEYVYSNSYEYEGFSPKWAEVSRNLSFDYMKENPQLADYRAMCAIARAPEILPDDLEPNFYSGEPGGSYSDLATELIWLLSHNVDTDLRERTSTGCRENAIRMADGNASLAIVQDDLFHFYEKNEVMMDSLKVASMKKIMPLHYEYLHFYTQHDITGLESHNVNVGPKTSGTFITAMAVLRSHGYTNITYSFDSPGDAVSRVNDNIYDAMFVMSGVPYYRFYSHDTWNVTSLLYDLAEVSFQGGSVPYPYDYDGIGRIIGDGSAVYENYPYCDQILPNDINTIRVRGLLVASPAFDDSNTGVFIKSVFRKAEYMTNPVDPDQWGDFEPDQLWIAITKQNVSVDETHGIYDSVTGAMDYFVLYPFGWTKKSTEYYLTLFPEND